MPIGSTIVVRLDAGSSIEGVLREIDDECLVIDAVDGEIILVAEAIEMVQRRDLRPAAELAPSRESPVPLTAAPVTADTAPVAWPSLPPAPAAPPPASITPPDLPVALETALAELRAAAARTSLDVSIPAFETPAGRDEAIHLRLISELDVVRNRYQYALKMRDADRVLDCITRLEAIADQYDAPELLRTAAQLAWPLGERERALDLFADAADVLEDGPSCRDLAMAQRLAGERELAPATLAGCVHEGTAPDDVALRALTALVAVQGEGAAELAGLVRTAARWPATEARLAVLVSGLLCADRSKLAGFPADQWNLPSLDAAAFMIAADAVAGGAVIVHGASDGTGAATPNLPPRPDTAMMAADGVPAAAPATPLAMPSRPPEARSGVEDPDVAVIADEIRGFLARRDLASAESALKRLQALAPGYPITWDLQRRVTGARTAHTVPSPSPATIAPVSISPHKRDLTMHPSLLMSRAEAAARRGDTDGVLRTLAAMAEDDALSAMDVRKIALVLGNKQQSRATALTVLERYRSRFTTRQELRDWLQTRSTILEHAGRWSEALDVLHEMLSEASPPDERLVLVRRINRALTKTYRHDEAKEFLAAELRRNPDQPAVTELIYQLDHVIATGMFSKVEATAQEEAAESGGLSPLLLFHLERCEYRGVPPDKVRSNNVTLNDIRHLDNMLQGPGGRSGTKIPRERADYNLSAARILQDLGITDGRFRSRLQNFAAAMGDHCVVEAQHADVIRTYYLEAINVRPEWGELVDVKLRQLVRSFVRGDDQLLESGKLLHLEPLLQSVMATKQLAIPVLSTLLPTVGKIKTRLIGRIWADRDTRELFQTALQKYLLTPMPVENQETFTRAWGAAAQQDRARQESYRDLSVLAGVPVLTAIDRHTRALDVIAKQMDGYAPLTDVNRLKNCAKVVDQLRQYAAPIKYVERERLAGSVTHTIQEHRYEIEKAPTVFSLQYLHPYLTALEKNLTEHFDAYDTAAAPENLKVELVVDRYLPDGAKVNVQLRVSNHSPDASPVSNVALTVLPSDDYESEPQPVPVAASIAADESKTCQIKLVASRRAVEQELMTLACEVSFTLRSGEQKTAAVDAKSIRLHADEEWREIPNPYIAGVKVEDPEMFKGRGRLIADVLATVTGSGHGSVVMYGQKRAGKSSVLYHLQNAIELPHVAASYDCGWLTDSVGNMTANRSLADFLHGIADAFQFRLRILAEEHGVSAPPRPDLDQIRIAPQQRFNEYMRELVEVWMRRTAPFAHSRLVLLLDEFSLLHKWIRTGNVPPDFMKGWKAILDRGHFRCALVGNDLMPRFIEEFPNEFQVIKRERVSYLDPTSALELIRDPILQPDGGSRYRGDADTRVLQLTGHSAYYIQLFCHALVNHMNSEDVRAPAIGPADVDAVADGLVRNLPIKEFDNLLTPGDAEVTDISDELVMEVLRATRKDSGSKMYHEADQTSHPQADRVLADLANREVVTRLSSNRFRLQVGLFSEWLQHQWS
ncbi:hypothetical protein I6A84_20610 [Frankia sp. CNm7]|uniref:Orc1-like AAA ATPase domain-containing protein n=1 Tax=Frankia nepalensis TaxID=1836974 RepID=A0A937RF20_9ACTN|nr:hypothetical protein [Frankia nepalensis]MBL7500314.1 hypothetical protein [Frankia nepalensis]MBL7520423.1 hypothetical protein [Frankia nepalensis]MBL7627664.1 hypothetical protein [Frankia nepalensis]